MAMAKDDTQYVTRDDFNNLGLIVFWVIGLGAFLSNVFIVGTICYAMQFLYLIRCSNKMKPMILVILGIFIVFYISMCPAVQGSKQYTAKTCLLGMK
jgi:hypothetical protein